MALNVPPDRRARIDQEAAAYFGHVDALLQGIALFETTDPADRVALIVTAIAHGLTGSTQERLDKATVVAAAALERLSQKEHTNAA
jgi:hypothetical protein